MSLKYEPASEPQVCKSETEYKGTSPYDKCNAAYGDESCLSRKP